jgi:hypothetical protein
MSANGDRLTNDESSKARKIIFLICDPFSITTERRLTSRISVRARDPLDSCEIYFALRRIDWLGRLYLMQNLSTTRDDHRLPQRLDHIERQMLCGCAARHKRRSAAWKVKHSIGKPDDGIGRALAVIANSVEI